MGEQVKTKERLMEENKAIKQEKKDLVAQLESEQGNIGEYTENQAKMSAKKAELEIELEDRAKFLKQMEEKAGRNGREKSYGVGNKSFQERYRRLRTGNSETRTRKD